jgi:hypothetical protein
MTDRYPHESSDDYAARLHTEMATARGAAIGAYGLVEQALAALCATLMDTDKGVIGIVFFRITSSWQRNHAIELLLKKKFGNEFDAYWHGLPGQPGRPKTSGLMALIRNLDETRNQIAHWTDAVNISGRDEDGILIRDNALQPPNIWAEMTELRQLKISDLLEFIAKARFVSASISQFSIFPRMPPSAQNTWREILQQPCTYPPPESHPLAPRPEEPGSFVR